jgi:tetratricopeptide (TPR) repeat protein/predicted Ser/Thr protein kinase
MVCSKCSAANPDTVRFCGQCGCALQFPDDARTVALDGLPINESAPAVNLTDPLGSVDLKAASPEGRLSPGTIFGVRYRIEGLLGQGGMGSVYKAYDNELDRLVALKLVRTGLADDLQTMQRFKQELLLASKISHKNILRIHDMGDWNGVKFITMAFVDGPDLASLMRRQGPLAFDRALNFTRQLCAALEAAHHEGVVHRDLKPQNILIDQSDNVYVTDFGLAKSLDAAATTMTRTGQILGTPRYMSPEQVEAGEVTQASDIYSLGLIVYEMFTGKRPFRGDTAMQLMYQRVTEPPQDPRSVHPGIPDYLAEIILKCLVKDPARRYQSAREILDDLDGRERKPAPPERRNRWGLAAAAVVLLAALLFAIPAARRAILGPAVVKPHYYLAVLPPKVADPSLQYAADGVVDALTAKLAGIDDVYVSYGESVKAAMRKPDARQIAEALVVDYLVSLNVLGSAGKISITVTLDEFGKHPGSRLHQDFPGAREDLLTLEDNVFKKLVAGLTIRETAAELARTNLAPTADRAAYDLYLKGRNLVRARQDQANLAVARDDFQQAVASDPRFALAYTGLADASLAMYDATKDQKWTAEALNAAQQADSLNTNLPEVHFSLGTIYTITGKTNLAIGELQLALEQAPNSDEGYRRLGMAYLKAGKRAEAIQALTRATEINPYYWKNFAQLGVATFNLGDNQASLKACRRVTELAPDNPAGWANLGAIEYRLGQFQECISSVEKAIALQPNKADFYSQLGVALFFSGHRDESLKHFAKAVELSPNSPFFRTNLGDAYRGSSQKDKAPAAYADAIKVANQALEVNPQDAFAKGYLATCYAKTGETGRALDYIQQARKIEPDDNDLMYREAVIYALARQNSDALKSLKNALEHGYSIGEVQNDADLAELRKTPEFAAMGK